MESNRFEIEHNKPFSESIIWQINRDFYQDRGISAWSDDIVPHHLTSNSKVGKTYAELIFSFLKDLALKGKTKETVYILELGAGHGRLAFHILRHLHKLTQSASVEIPSFCYVLSDIVEENLSFFQQHPQFQEYFQKGLLDVSYFDAIEGKHLYLRISKKTIRAQELAQPILAIGNYFFDSIPNDLFLVKDNLLSSCSVSISSSGNPDELDPEEKLKSLKLTYHKSIVDKPYYENPIFNELLDGYRDAVSNTYLFFPKKAMMCIDNIKQLSAEGMVLLSIDKGFHEIHDIENKKEPDIIKHGSFSLWVNYHALGNFCTKQGGKALFPSYSTFHLELACLLFLKDGESYTHMSKAYEKSVNDFGPDDFNSIKHLAYYNVSRLDLRGLIALYRLSEYDSTFFIKLLPRLKHVSKTISFNDRTRISQTLHSIWDVYFNINETFDLAYEIGGILYDLGFYEDALDYFQYSVNLHGQKADTYYNKALAHYQLRQDKQFFITLNKAKEAYPEHVLLKELDKLDMG